MRSIVNLESQYINLKAPTLRGVIACCECTYEVTLNPRRLPLRGTRKQSHVVSGASFNSTHELLI